MDADCKKQILEWLRMDGYEANAEAAKERTAKWMSRTLGICGIREARKLIAEALAS